VSDRGRPRLDLRVTFDYVDPGSYLVRELLERWRDEGLISVGISWHPLELRTPDESPVDPTAPEWQSLERAMIGAAERAGTPLGRPQRIPWTRKAHELAFHAREKGLFEEVHRGLFEAHFFEGRDIGRVDHLVELGERLGLESAEARTVLGVDRFTSAVEAARIEALRAEIRGVPTIEVGEFRVEGLGDVDGLRELLVGLAGPE
jgi:predicted DsbA family dithiol-disulfide isomerase